MPMRCRNVYDRFGDDPDIAALYVDSQIMLTPWELFDIDSRTPNPKARTTEIHAALERGLAGAGRNHIGLLHYDIHFREMSPTPERALDSAQRLEMSDTGDAGHLAHMPSHIHALVGDFERAARCSRLAVALDREQQPHLERTPFYRTLHCHDAHMLMFAGMQTGNLGDATHGAAVISGLLCDVLVEPPTTHMMMTLEGYLSTTSPTSISGLDAGSRRSTGIRRRAGTPARVLGNASLCAGRGKRRRWGCSIRPDTPPRRLTMPVRRYRWRRSSTTLPTPFWLSPI